MADAIKILTIEGRAIDGVAGFYDEINRVFMSGEDWKLGESLDGLNDLFHGGFGAVGDEKFILVWRDMDASKAALGLDATRDFYRAKLARPDLFNAGWAQDKLAELEAGVGQTYFDFIMEIIADHPKIELRAA